MKGLQLRDAERADRRRHGAGGRAGRGSVSIDGGPEQRLDYYSGIRVGEELNYLSPMLPAAPHTLRVRVTGARNPASGSTVISMDRIEIYGAG